MSEKEKKLTEEKRQKVARGFARLDRLRTDLNEVSIKLLERANALTKIIEEITDEGKPNTEDGEMAYNTILTMISEKLSQETKELDTAQEELGLELVKVTDLLGIDTVELRTAKEAEGE